VEQKRYDSARRCARCLDRDLGRKSYGDEGYSREELVAELGSAFLCADLDLHQEPREDNAAYIATWLRFWNAGGLCFVEFASVDTGAERVTAFSVRFPQVGFVCTSSVSTDKEPVMIRHSC
jgi:antirestriction protein ArdC